MERFGKYFLRRPEPKALWEKALSEERWAELVSASFVPGAGFGKAGKEDSGTWKVHRKMEEKWKISSPYPRFNLKLGLTSFKHTGVFPEQEPNWKHIFDKVKSLKTSAPKVLNLFAYTGAASLAAKAAGADVTHLDSVRQVVTWARENMELSGLDGIRWVVEDAMKFAEREVRRGHRYHGIILDPPTYGHGPNGEKWRLEDSLYDMLRLVHQLSEPSEGFVVLNLYSNGVSPALARSAFKAAFELRGEDGLESGELALRDEAGRELPLSVYVRYEK